MLILKCFVKLVLRIYYIIVHYNLSELKNKVSLKIDRSILRHLVIVAIVVKKKNKKKQKFCFKAIFGIYIYVFKKYQIKSFIVDRPQQWKVTVNFSLKLF